MFIYHRKITQLSLKGKFMFPGNELKNEIVRCQNKNVKTRKSENELTIAL